MTIMMVTPNILLEKWWSCDGHADGHDGHTFKLEKKFLDPPRNLLLKKLYFFESPDRHYYFNYFRQTRVTGLSSVDRNETTTWACVGWLCTVRGH
jgi:hypothetical protein